MAGAVCLAVPMISLRYGIRLIVPYFGGSVGAILLVYAVVLLLFDGLDPENVSFVVGSVSLSAVLGGGLAILGLRFLHKFSRWWIGLAVLFSAAFMTAFVLFGTPGGVMFHATSDTASLIGFLGLLFVLCSVPFHLGWLLTVLIVPKPPDMARLEDVKAFE